MTAITPGTQATRIYEPQTEFFVKVPFTPGTVLSAVTADFYALINRAGMLKTFNDEFGTTSEITLFMPINFVFNPTMQRDDALSIVRASAVPRRIGIVTLRSSSIMLVDTMSRENRLIVNVADDGNVWLNGRAKIVGMTECSNGSLFLVDNSF